MMLNGWFDNEAFRPDDYFKMGKAVYQANDMANLILTTAWSPN